MHDTIKLASKYVPNYTYLLIYNLGLLLHDKQLRNSSLKQGSRF